MNPFSPFLKPFYTALFLLVCFSATIAQPFPTPGDDHLSAPIISCIDGYTFTLGPVEYNINFPGYCGDMQNTDWLAFIAEAPDMVLSAEVFNCQAPGGPYGIQLGVLGVGNDCMPSEFYRVACEGDGYWSQKDIPLSGLVPGSIYYIAVDGYANDRCDYRLTLDTPLQGPPPPVNSALTGPSVVQSGSISSYNLDLVIEPYIDHNPCGNEYVNCDGNPGPCDWEYSFIWSAPPGSVVVPGTPATDAIITWGPISGQVCVEISNTCFNSITLCLDVEVVNVNPGPCTPGSPTVPGDSCADAPFLCGTALNGFCGNNTGVSADVPGNLAGELSCAIDNNQWIRFTPCATDVHLAIETSGCQLGSNLEISVLEVDDCIDFSSVLDCQLLPASFTSSFEVQGLVPGEVYYLMIDGVNGIGCDYQIYVLDGISMEAPEFQEVTAGFISGPSEVCPEEQPIYTLTPPDCIPVFADGCAFPDELAADLRLVWHLPPSMEFVGDSVDVLSIQVAMTDTVDGSIYVTYETVDGADVYCTFGIGDCGNVPAFPVTINYLITNLPTAFICEDETFDFCGQSYNQSQSLVCPEYCGEIRQELVVVPFDTIPLQVVEICEGECFDYCGINYCGTQSTVLYCRQGCDFFAQEIIVHPKVVNDFGVVDICVGDCLDFQGQEFCSDGTFEVEKPGAFGCDETFRITIQYYTPPALLTSAPNTDCEVNSNAYQVQFNIINGVPPFTINGTPITGNSFTSDWIPNGVAYDFQISDSDFCAATTAVQGVFDCTSLCTTDAGTLQGLNLTACGNESVAVAIGTDAVIDINDTYSYVLHNGSTNSVGTILANNTNGIFNFDPGIMSYSQTYVLSVIVGNGVNGLVDMDDACHSISDGLEITFSELPLASATAQGVITCTELESLVSAGPAITGATYLWNGPGGFTSSDSEFTTSIPGDYNLVLTNADGCTISSNAMVEENRNAPVLDAGATVELNCTDLELQLRASLTFEGSDIDYFWETNTGNFVEGKETLSPWVDAPGWYYLSAYNRENGCNSQDSVLVTLNANYPEAVELSIIHPSCFGASSGKVEIISVTGGETPYLYALNEEPFGQNPVLTNLEPGAYDLIVQDANGCEFVEQIVLNQPKELVVDLGEDLYLDLGDQVYLDAISNFDVDSVSWTVFNGDDFTDTITGLSHSFQAMYTQGIRLEAFEKGGCTTTDVINIYVDQREKVFIPNAFSPNGDGDNDFFTVFSGDAVDVVSSMTIYGRWGDVVYQRTNFEPNDLDLGWDGTFGGKNLNDGVYIYKIELLLVNGRKETYAGDLALIK